MKIKELFFSSHGIRATFPATSLLPNGPSLVALFQQTFFDGPSPANLLQSRGPSPTGLLRWTISGGPSPANHLRRTFSRRPSTMTLLLRTFSGDPSSTDLRSTLSSLPIYFLSLFRMPKLVCSRLEKSQRAKTTPCQLENCMPREK